MGQDWRDCIVVYIDLIGTKTTKDPVKRMRSLHALLHKTKCKLNSIDYAYAWNDCALLLSFVNRPEAYFETMRDAESLKKRIDRELGKSYAVAIKGQAFPEIDATTDAQDSGVIVIKASSWAMANCFEVEDQARKCRWTQHWYVDSRIADRIRTDRKSVKKEVSMFGAQGKRQARPIHAFKDYLWNDDPHAQTQTDDL